MNQAQLISLVDRLRALPTETEWVEFKRDNTNPQLIGEYLSALANGACLRQQPVAILSSASTTRRTQSWARASSRTA